jgi:prepilin-type processing-associated H-X9-DG protein
VSNVTQLNLGVMMYASDNKDLFPSGATWCDALKQYSMNEKTFLCAQAKPGQRCHYALNAQLVGRELKDVQVPAETVLIFETDGGWNLSGSRELLLAKPRHDNGYVVGFADGHAELVRPERLEKLRWEP